MHDDDEIIREFLIESNENLNRLDAEMVDLERHPTSERLAGIFRTIHTIKGTCGFFGFDILESISHHTENILSQLRAGQRQVSGPLVSVILESVDAIRQILRNIESTRMEGTNKYLGLVDRLERIASHVGGAEWEEKSVVPEIEDSEANGLPSLAAGPFLAGPAPVTPENEKAGTIADSSIRVDVSLLDKLMNLVGELVLARNQILQFSGQLDDSGLNATSQRLNLITSELQEGVMKTRMQPIGMIWNKLPRVVRDIAHALGKQLELEMEGADTELDKTIIEAIKDPITHMVRNACDHGIELPEARVGQGKSAQGTLRLKAYHEGGQVNVEITDDGAGIDVETIKRKAIEKGLIRSEQASLMNEREAVGLLFLPGFSTAKAVTNVSGRGVGMDVVRANVEKVGGAVEVSTRLGEGTTVRLKIPLTLAIVPGLVVTSGGQCFVIPQVSLLELIRLENDAQSKIEFAHQTPVYRRRGTLLPIAYLNDVLKLPPSSGETRNIVVLQAEDRQFGLIVDGVNDTQEIVVKPLGKQLKQLTCYSGSTIMGDGTVALILDVLGVGYLSGVLNHARETRSRDLIRHVPGEGQTQRVLLFSSGRFQRLAIPLELVARLEEFSAASIEHAGGYPVIQYRDQILPLVNLSQTLDPVAADSGAALESVASMPPSAKGSTIPVIVFSHGASMIGLMVDQIIDIVDEKVTLRRSGTPRPGIIGSAVIGRKIADFLDLQAVLQAIDDQFLGSDTPGMVKVLIAEASPFHRSLLRSQLAMSGYDVVVAGSSSETLQRLEQDQVQVVVVSGELLMKDQAGIQKVRSLTAAAHIPMLAISDSTAEMSVHKASGIHFEDHQLRIERAALLESIARLAQVLRSTKSPKAGELVYV